MKQHTDCKERKDVDPKKSWVQCFLSIKEPNKNKKSECLIDPNDNEVLTKIGRYHIFKRYVFGESVAKNIFGIDTATENKAIKLHDVITDDVTYSIYYHPNRDKKFLDELFKQDCGCFKIDIGCDEKNVLNLLNEVYK
jgi:hypothetical protein